MINAVKIVFLVDYQLRGKEYLPNETAYIERDRAEELSKLNIARILAQKEVKIISKQTHKKRLKILSQDDDTP